MRPLVLVVAFLLGAATAVLVACGEDRRLPGDDASSLTGALSQVSAAVESGSCDEAAEAVRQAESVLETLPSEVDRGLRDRLRQGVENLSAIVPTTCRSATTEPAPPTTTEETPTETEPDTTTEPPPTETEPSTTETTPTEPPTTEPGPGNGNGNGNGVGNGGTPPGQEGKD